MTGLSLLVALFVALAAMDWWVLAKQRRAHRLRPRPDREQLERIIAQAVLSVAATGIAITGINRVIGLGISGDVLALLLVGALLAISAPGLVWLWMFRGKA